jgi:hypothetical protein
MANSMFHTRFFLTPLIAFCCCILHGAEIGPVLEFAKVDLRLAYDYVPAVSAAPDGLSASKQDSAVLSPEPVTSEPCVQTNQPPMDLSLAAPVDPGTVSLRPVATGKAPALGLFRKRLSSRYSSGAWVDLRSGYGDVLVEDRVGRVQLNGAGIQDPDFLYLKLCFRF